MREENEVRLPDRGMTAEIKGHSILSRLGLNLLTTAIFHFVMNCVSIWSVVPVALAAILFLFGWKAKPPEALAEKGITIEKRVKATVKELTGGESGEQPHRLPSVVDVAAGQAGKRIGNKIDDAKEDVIDAIKARKDADIAAERERLIVEARKLHVAFEESWTTDKLRAEVEHARDELIIRKPLYDRAKVAGLDYLEIWPTKELRQHVERREKWLSENVQYQAALRAWEEAMEKWRDMVQHGPNARCPRCKNAMRISPSAAKRSLQCRACLYFFNGFRGHAMWSTPKAPKKPAPPKEWNLFG